MTLLLTTCIALTIDRIEVMVRRAEMEQLFEFLTRQCKRQKLDTSKHDTTKCDVKHYKYMSSLVTVKIPLFRIDLPLQSQWVYISVSDPDEVVQQWIKLMCWKLGNTQGRPNAAVKEVEVAMDLITNGKKEAERIWRYLGKHLFTVGSRVNSYNRVKTTRYVGRKGDAEHAATLRRSTGDTLAGWRHSTTGLFCSSTRSRTRAYQSSRICCRCSTSW
jgi:hypothetical protein